MTKAASEQAPIRDKHWKDAYAFANAPERQHDFVGSLAQLLANNDSDVRQEMLEEAAKIRSGSALREAIEEAYSFIINLPEKITFNDGTVPGLFPKALAEKLKTVREKLDARADNQDMAMLLMMCAPTSEEITQQRAGIFPDSQMKRLVDAAKAIRKDAFAAGVASNKKE